MTSISLIRLEDVTHCAQPPPPHIMGKFLGSILASPALGISCNKGLFRKFRYSFHTDKFNEIKEDERNRDDKRDRMYDLPSQLKFICVTTWNWSHRIIIKCCLSKLAVFLSQYRTRARIETGSAGRGVSTTMRHLMGSISTSLEPALIFWPRTATQLHHSTRCG